MGTLSGTGIFEVKQFSYKICSEIFEGVGGIRACVESQLHKDPPQGCSQKYSNLGSVDSCLGNLGQLHPGESQLHHHGSPRLCILLLCHNLKNNIKPLKKIMIDIKFHYYSACTFTIHFFKYCNRTVYTLVVQ